MNLLELLKELTNAQKDADFYGIKIQDIQISVRDMEGKEFNLNDAFSVIRTLHGVVLVIES